MLLSGRALMNQGNNPYWLAMNAARTILFVLFTNDRCVKAYDLTDPWLPVLLGTSPTLGASPAYLAVYGTNVFVTDQMDLTLKVVNAANPAALSVAATLAFSAGGSGGSRCAVNTAGTQLLIGGPESGVNDNKATLVDVTTPAAPVVLGTSAAFGATHRGLEYLGGTKWAVASRDDRTVRIIDSSTPSLPAEVATITTTQGNTTAAVKLHGTDLYVGNYGVGFLEKWDVSNPLLPTLVASTSIAAGAEQIDITPDGANVLVACRPSHKLVVVDAHTMTVTDTVEVAGTVTPGVATTDDFAYLTAAGDPTNGLIYVFALLDTMNIESGGAAVSGAEAAGQAAATVEIG